MVQSRKYMLCSRGVKLQGADVVDSTPADFKRFVEHEYRKWGGIVQIVEAKLD
jgi:hypothetical protein